jgi:DNA polymerase-3 subunit epsilon
MVHRPLVFLDIETTGGSATTSRVLEIGAIRVEQNQIVREYKQLLFPEANVPYFITRLTGIRNEDVWDAPTFQGIADELELLLDGAIFVAHNVNFDYSFIKAEFARLGRRFSADRFCTARLSRLLYPQHKRHNLDSIIERHAYKVQSRHRAFDDAKVLYTFYADQLAKFNLDVYRSVNRIMIKGYV